MNNRRDLFEFQRGEFRVGVAVRGRVGTNRYIGVINGEERVFASGKGELMRMLLQMTSERPAA